MTPHHARPASDHHAHVRRQRAFVEAVRLEPWHRKVVYGITAALVASGVLWLTFRYFVRATGPFGEVHHPMEAWMLKLHGLAAMLSMLALGSLVLSHMRRAWVLKRNVSSGLVLGSIFVVLIATGYALYYFASEEARPILSAIHWVVGLGSGPLLALHIVLGRRRAALRASEVVSDTLHPVSAAGAAETRRTA